MAKLLSKAEIASSHETAVLLAMTGGGGIGSIPPPYIVTSINPGPAGVADQYR